MAGMCCGIKVGENERTSSVEPASRTARRRTLELRKFISDFSDDHRLNKRSKVAKDKIETLTTPDPAHALRLCDDKADETSATVLELASKQPEVKIEVTAELEFPKFGFTSVCGRRKDMEDAVSIRLSFCGDEVNKKRKYAESSCGEDFHFYGVFDGHGCSHVAMRCKERMHAIIKEEIGVRDSNDWSETMLSSFINMDKEVSDRSSAGDASISCRCGLKTPQCDAVGSTAVVAVVTPDTIVVSNCGDSRAVLCRGGVAIPLSTDHKPDRPEELNRIEQAGGRVIYWDGARVLGMLAMSRAIGDNYLKPYVIPDPEVTITTRSADDECLILASDGLWDVVSNETATTVARMCLLNAERPASPPRSPGSGLVVDAGSESSDKACSDASILLTKLALARHSSDNVSVVVVDLRRNR